MIILMGVPGVGKSSVLDGVKQIKPNYKIVNYGNLMFEMFKKRYGLQKRDEIRKASITRQKAIQKDVALKLSKMDKKNILDTHCSIQTTKGYLPGLPFDLLKKLKVERLILLSATIDEIYNRRKNDCARTREMNKDEIIEHDQMNKAYLAAYSAFTGAPATIILNRDNKLQEAIEKFALLLD